MTLALAAGNLSKIAIRQLLRTGQNRTGDIDLVVTSKTANDVTRRIVDRCQLCAKLRKRPGLHLLDQVSEHVVEHADLLRIETGCIASLEPAARTCSSSSITDAACDISCLGQDSSCRLSLSDAGASNALSHHSDGRKAKVKSVDIRPIGENRRL